MWRSRYNSFRADGANGQYILVIPEKNAVVVTTAHIQDMQAELNLIWKYIYPALQKATDDRLIKKNPAIGCKIPPKKSREMQVLTPDEIKRFLIQAKYDGFLELFILELSTGMRRGEILGIQWDDLNIQTGELKISRQVAILNGKIHIK